MFFPFEEYIHSYCEAEYKDDVKKKNNIVKYVNILNEAPDDYLSYYKFCNNAIFFRNTFTKEAFIYFFLNKFSESEKELLGKTVFNMFTKSSIGVIGEHKNHFVLSWELYPYVKHHSIIDESFKKINSELKLV